MLKNITKKIITFIILATTVIAPFTPTITHAQIEINTEQELADKTALPSCLSLTDGTVKGCVGQLLYWAAWWPTHWLAARSGGFLDYFIFFSINTTTYKGVPLANGSNFIQEGWEVVRNIANLAFIFALLYIGLSFVVGNTIGGTDPKKLLIYVIVMALLINFSLYISRIVVDAGNILAKTLYNQINLVGKNSEGTYLDSPDGIKSIGLMLISLANPQKLILSQTQDSVIVQGDAANTNAIYFIMVTIGAIIFNLFLIYLFLSVAFFFLGRIVGLYFSMIFSPLAFATLALPKGSSVPYLGFQSWLKDLVGASFMAPVYLFFIYLTIKFLQIGIPINPNVSGSHEVAQIFMSIAIPFALAIAFLIIGKKVAEKMSGEVGRTVASGATKALVVAGGVGFGAAAMVGGAALAGGTKAIMSSGRLQKAATSGKLRMNLFGKEINMDRLARGAARTTLRTADKVRNTSFDARDNKAFKAGNKIMGVVAGATGGKVIDFGKSRPNYTIDDREKARDEKRTKELKRDESLFEISGLEKQRHNDSAKDHNKKLDPEAEKEFDKKKAKAEKNFRKTDHFKNLASGHEKEQALYHHSEEFDKDYAKGIVQEKYNSDGTASLGLDDVSVKANRLALALENLRETAEYQGATPEMQATMETNAEDVFYDNYADDSVVKEFNVVANTGRVSPKELGDVNNNTYGWNDQIRVGRFEDLLAELKESDWYKNTATEPEKADREWLLNEEFNEEYDENGMVITKVDTTTGDSQRNRADMSQIDEVDKTTEKYNDKKFLRMKNASQINRTRKQLFAQEMLRDSQNEDEIYRDMPLGEKTRRRATESYAREELKDANKENNKLKQIDRLTTQLAELDDVLAGYYHIAKNNSQTDLDEFKKTNKKEVYEAASEVPTDVKASLAGDFDNELKRQSVKKELAKISQHIQGEIGKLDAKVLNIQTRAANENRKLKKSEAGKISKFLRRKAKLQSDATKIAGGLDQRIAISERIATARSRD